MPVERLPDLIEAYHRASTLVVVNLVAKGTFQLSNLIAIGAGPFQRTGNIDPTTWRRTYESLPSWKGKKIVILDSTVPPFLRKALIPQLKEMIKAKLDIVVISTQLIEAGVDLDFETGILDWQGLASTLQRGGRVGREGGQHAKTAHVFELLDEVGRTSYRILKDLQRLPPLSELQSYSNIQAQALEEEDTWFHQWNEGTTIAEANLAQALEAQLLRAAHRAPVQDWKNILTAKPLNSQQLGLDLASLQHLTALYGDEHGGEQLIVFESEAKFHQVRTLIRLGTQEALKMAGREINERTINCYNPEVLGEIIRLTGILRELGPNRLAVIRT